MDAAERAVVEAAQRRASQIVGAAWEKAERLQEEALAELQGEVDRRLRDATAAADRIRHAGERSAASVRAEAEAERERARQELAAEAEAFWARARGEADAVLREARDAAVRILAEAAAEAARVRAHAAGGPALHTPGPTSALARPAPPRPDPPPDAAPPDPPHDAAPPDPPPDPPPDVATPDPPHDAATPDPRHDPPPDAATTDPTPVAPPDPADRPTGALRLLLVCTGNIRRSPMAEVFLRRALHDRGVDAEVGSAGLLDAGQPASGTVAEVITERGLDLSGHRSRRVTAEGLRAADLVIGMERAHVREAVVRAEDVFGRAFTLRELVRRAETCGPRHPDEPFDSWLGRLHEGRELDDLLTAGDGDDIADPARGSARRAARTADEIERLVNRFVELAWGRAHAGAVGRDLPPGSDGDDEADGDQRGLLRRILGR